MPETAKPADCVIALRYNETEDAPPPPKLFDPLMSATVQTRRKSATTTVTMPITWAAWATILFIAQRYATGALAMGSLVACGATVGR